MKIDVETTKYILQRNITDINKINQIMQDIELELKAEEEEKANRPPPVKKQFGIIVSDPNGQLEGIDLVGWVVQLPEDDSVTTGPERIIRAAYEYNTTPKGRRMPVRTVGEACEVVSPKLFKEQNVVVKTKIPVLVVTTPNTIPNEKTPDE